jgi:L-ascorbate metabolism protein UlaG (beta-lactamase superfamily)
MRYFMNMTEQFEVNWHGHACFTVGMTKKVIIDPFLEGNPVARIKPDSVKVDMVAVTHGHFDHVADAVKIALKNSAPLVTMVELAGILQEENKDLNAIGINYSGSTTIDGIKFTSVPAFHSSGYNGKYGGSPMGIIITDGLKLYHGGDTGVFKDMEVIRDLYKPDISLLPIGGYFTMGIPEALYASKMLGSKYVIPMHYNTFDAIRQDPNKFVEGFKGLKGQHALLAEIEKPLMFDKNGNKL